jgi:hypothetical protein
MCTNYTYIPLQSYLLTEILLLVVMYKYRIGENYQYQDSILAERLPVNGLLLHVRQIWLGTRVSYNISFVIPA